MKKLSVISFVAIAALMVMMSSCLSEGDNISKGTVYGYIGPVDGIAGRVVLNIGDNNYPLYSPTLAGMDYGYYSCYYEVNSSSEENQNPSSTGYMVASISVQYQFGESNVMEGGELETETSTLLENEQTVYTIQSFNYVNKALMLGIGYDKLKKDQVNKHVINFYREEEPEQENGYNVYNLYLRSVMAYEGSGTSTSADYIYDAYRLNDFYNYTAYNEQNKEKGGFYVRIKYVSDIDDKGEIKWQTTGFLPITVPTE